jgi:hypothetical protein
MPIGRRRNRIDRSLRERGVPPEPQQRPREQTETEGPWDETDVPDGGPARIDLGALRLPALADMELRVEVGPQGQVVGATLREGESLLSVAAFAAPRAGGLWDDVREEIARSASGQGGSLKEASGPFGTELAGTVLAMPAVPEGTTPQPIRVPARFLGVDGPRWFLRGTITGPAGAGGAAAAALEQAFRDVVVVRGTEPMPVRDPLPLTLPAQAAEQMAEQLAREQGGGQEA